MRLQNTHRTVVQAEQMVAMWVRYDWDRGQTRHSRFRLMLSNARAPMLRGGGVTTTRGSVLEDGAQGRSNDPLPHP